MSALRTVPIALLAGLTLLVAAPAASAFTPEQEQESVALYAPEARMTIVALGNTSTSEDPVRPSPMDGEGLEGVVPLLAAALTE